MMDQAAHHAEELKIQQDIEEALLHAQKLGLPTDEVKLLAWASGIQLRKGKHEVG